MTLKGLKSLIGSCCLILELITKADNSVLFNMRQLKKISVKNSKKVEDLLGLIDLGKVEQVKQASGIFQAVNDVLRKYKGFPRVIWADQIEDYFNKCYVCDVVAIDTETDNSVDPVTAIMVGLCLYTPYSRPVYIPVNHYDRQTLQKIPNQVDVNTLREKIEKFKNFKCIYHNAKFDVNVIDTNLGIRLPIYWDTMIAAKVLNENDMSAALKAIYVKYIEPAQPTYNISNLFVENKTAPVEDFALYSAIDPYDTYKIYLMQKKVLESPTMQKLYNLLINVEFKITEIAAQMEQEGANFDKNLAEIYLKKFEKLAADKQEELNNFFEPLKYKSDFKLQEWPINVSSSDQVVSALNAMGVKCDDSQEPTLKALSKAYPVCKTILECRSANHMVTSFFRPYIEMVNVKTGRLHASFDQMGSEDKTVKTGRFSCIAEGTKILTTQGLKSIEAFEPGDEVYCYFGKTLIPAKVSAVLRQGVKECLSLTFRSVAGDVVTLRCTPDHRILLADFLRTWKEAKDLVVGDIVRGAAGDSNSPTTYTLIKSQEFIPQFTYDLTIPTYHNFIAAGICVHNCRNPNLQQLPSFDDSVRLCFNGSEEIQEEEFDDDTLEIFEDDEIETLAGYKFAKNLQVGDLLIDPENIRAQYRIESISVLNARIRVKLSIVNSEEVI